MVKGGAIFFSILKVQPRKCDYKLLNVQVALVSKIQRPKNVFAHIPLNEQNKVTLFCHTRYYIFQGEFLEKKNFMEAFLVKPKKNNLPDSQESRNKIIFEKAIIRWTKMFILSHNSFTKFPFNKVFQPFRNVLPSTIVLSVVIHVFEVLFCSLWFRYD